MKTRNQALETAKKRQFDLVVIGGGIAGAGIAQNAASRGLSVCLLEKEDFASGTSSRTTKLIHGGLRYLEQLHIMLTKELCQERELLATLAPHLVRDLSMIMPIVKDNWFFGIKAELGLTLYDLVSWSHTHNRHERLSKQEVLAAAPALSSDIIAGGLRFHDCITDDARMVLEVIKSATKDGAIAINYMKVVGFAKDGNQIVGVNCHDRIDGSELTIAASAFVNATGIWADEVFQMLEANWKPQVAPSKGIHIVVPGSALETNSALFLPTKDGRYCFVIPWQKALMIGTTDEAYSGNLDSPMPNSDEIDYLLQVTNGFLSGRKLNRSDIIGSFAGLRPLIKPKNGDMTNTSNMSREHLIFETDDGVVGLIGGKLTNYRLMANQVVDKLIPKFPQLKDKPSRTQKIMLGGFVDKNDFLAQTASILAKGRKLEIDPATIDHLLASYGQEALIILDAVEADGKLNERICPDFPPIYAEVPFCVNNEMAVSLEDLLMRRLRLGILNQRQCLEAAPRVARMMQQVLGWDNKRLQGELEGLDNTLIAHIEKAQATAK